MGTKTNPGLYDCHASAAPDEPLFTLLARDRLAPYLVRIWAHLRRGDRQLAAETITHMPTRISYRNKPDIKKIVEAFQCADDMEEWRVANRRPVIGGERD